MLVPPPVDPCINGLHAHQWTTLKQDTKWRYTVTCTKNSRIVGILRNTSHVPQYSLVCYTTETQKSKKQPCCAFSRAQHWSSGDGCRVRTEIRQEPVPYSIGPCANELDIRWTHGAGPEWNLEKMLCCSPTAIMSNLGRWLGICG